MRGARCGIFRFAAHQTATSKAETPLWASVRHAGTDEAVSNNNNNQHQKMTTNQIFCGALGLAYIDIFAVSRFVGKWEAAVFAGLATMTVGLLIITAHRWVK